MFEESTQLDEQSRKYLLALGEVAELDAIWEELFADANVCLDRLQQNGAVELGDNETLVFNQSINQREARLFIRAQASAIEATLYRMRQLAIHMDQASSTVFSVEEIMAANEKAPSVDSRGQVKTRSSFINAEASFRMAFDMLARASNSKYNPDYKGVGWNKYRRTIKVRNRLTHPKSISEAKTSSEEIQNAFQAGLWFMRTYETLIKDASRILKERMKQESNLQERRDWSDLSLSLAMRGMEEEDSPEYALSDLKERFS